MNWYESIAQRFYLRRNMPSDWRTLQKVTTKTFPFHKVFLQDIRNFSTNVFSRRVIISVCKIRVICFLPDIPYSYCSSFDTVCLRIWRMLLPNATFFKSLTISKIAAVAVAQPRCSVQTAQSILPFTSDVLLAPHIKWFLFFSETMSLKMSDESPA